MGLPNPFAQHKSLEELEEENEEQELKLSIAQKKALIKKLEQHGGNPSDFKKKKGGGFSFGSIISWLKTH
jgi:hypothetical protein